MQSKLADVYATSDPVGISTTVWTAGRAIYIPIKIPWPYPVKRMFIFNGGSVAGNVDLGLYTRNGTKVFSTGSFAQVGVTTMQYVNFSYLVSPGSYYLALAFSGVATIQRAQFALVTNARMAGLLQQDSAFPLPASMTPAVYTLGGIYMFGMTLTESWY
jgi:hypothetical protein